MWVPVAPDRDPGVSRENGDMGGNIGIMENGNYYLGFRIERISDSYFAKMTRDYSVKEACCLFVIPAILLATLSRHGPRGLLEILVLLSP